MGRPRGRRICLGRRTGAGRQTSRKRLARPFPLRKHRRRRLGPHLAGQGLRPKRVWPLRHDRQRLGMDPGLVVCGRNPARQELLRARQPEGGRQVRQRRSPCSTPPASGDEGRFPSLRAELLPPIPACSPSSASRRHLDFAYRLSMREAGGRDRVTAPFRRPKPLRSDLSAPCPSCTASSRDDCARYRALQLAPGS